MTQLILLYSPSEVGGIASPAFSYLRHWFVLAIACIMWFKSQFAIVFFYEISNGAKVPTKRDLCTKFLVNKFFCKVDKNYFLE